MSTTAVILAAGLGTRMQSSRPKALHLLGGRPMLCELLESAASVFDRVVVVIGPEMAEVAALVAPHPVVVQQERLGTAHAALTAASQFGDGEVVVLYADTPLIRPATLSRLLARKKEMNAALALLAFHVPESGHPAHYGRLMMANGFVQSIVEWADATPKQRAERLCNAGGFVAAGADLRRWLEQVPLNAAKGEYYLTDIVGLAAAEGARIVALEAPFVELRGINSQAELAEAEATLQGWLRAAVMETGVSLVAPETVFLCSDTVLAADVRIGPFVVFGPGVVVEAGAEILPFCHLEGCHIGPASRIGPYARIRKGTTIGAAARVGNFVELKAAALGVGAKANHLAYLGDTEIGPSANIGAGTITCNYDGVAKHRTVIGADAFIGSNAALVAPVEIGAGAIVGAGSVIVRDVPPDALAIARGQQVLKEGRAKLLRSERKRRATKAAAELSTKASEGQKENG
jgi:bifunctional UDP-N-acetylglucosamine pyrophosphorylase/glucosamine-1-phosphate N-acetyltransferase